MLQSNLIALGIEPIYYSTLKLLTLFLHLGTEQNSHIKVTFEIPLKTIRKTPQSQQK